MGMSINTNVMSINAQRNSAANDNSLATSIQRLSSGLRVNSARDDAAGLAIASRMDAQARGMNVAVRNANDGISLVQTAESGMAVIGDMLQRMRELAVQGSNQTNSESDLTALKAEYDQLIEEITRTTESVKFNGVSLLDATDDVLLQVGADEDQTITISKDDSLNIAGDTDLTAATGSTFGTTPADAAGDNGANVTLIDDAIQAVNTFRSQLGSYQNRISYTISFLQSASENQQAARGRIMDADFAVETANLSRAQILKQAGTAMVAQANQLPQGVLALLK